MDTPPSGYAAPFLVYLVELADGEDQPSYGQAGGFTTEAEAVRVRDTLLGEGFKHAYVNMVPIHARAMDWQHDR